MVNDDKIGETTVKALLSLLITETLEFYSITNSMSDTQIALTINLILAHEEFCLMKPDFFMMCFDNAKMFRYGKNFNRIDGNIIFDWLNQCNLDCILEIENLRVSELGKINKNRVSYGDFSVIPEDKKDIPVPMPDNVKEMLSNIGKKLPEPKKEIIVDPTQLLVNSFVKDFNEKSTEKSGLKLIQVDSKYLDINKYLEYRMDKHKEEETSIIIEMINTENPIANITQKGYNESIYQCELFNGDLVSFYCEHKECEKMGIKLFDKMNAIELLPFI